MFNMSWLRGFAEKAHVHEIILLKNAVGNKKKLDVSVILRAKHSNHTGA